MWRLFLNGDCVLASMNHDDLIEYLEDFVPGRYRAEIEEVQDERLIDALAPVQAPSGSFA